MNDNNKKKITIRKASKRSTRKENNSEINETEALMNQLEQLSFSEDKSFEDQTLFSRSRSLYKNGTKDLINNFYANINQQNLIPEEREFIKTNINNNRDHFDYNDRKETLKLKLDNILTTLRLSDIKLNIRYYSSLFKFKEYLKDNILVLNYFCHFNDLFNIIIELLFIIKKENEKNEMYNSKSTKNGMILKLEKEINYKDKQIGELLNKLKIEEEKVKKNSKDNSNELIILKKENRELYYQLSLYKNHIKKLDTNNIILEEKLNNFILEKLNKRSSSVNNRIIGELENKTINMNNNININNFNGIIPSTPPNLDVINFNENVRKKINKEDSAVRKLNINLINLLKEINKILGVYDLSLNKINIEETQTNVVTNLNNMIDYNILNDPDKMDNFHKSILGNMDKILSKIDKLIDNYKKNITKKTKEFNNNNVNTKRIGSSNIRHRINRQSHEDAKPFIYKSNEKEKEKIKIFVNRKNFSAIKETKIKQKNIKDIKYPK